MLVFPWAHPAQGEDEPHARQDELLIHAIQLYSHGYLAEAWDSLARFHQHPKRNEIHHKTFFLCFAYRRCPQVPHLAQILGKSREDAGFIRGFCPKWIDWPAQIGVLPKGYESWQDYFNLIARRFLMADSCESWSEDILNQLGSAQAEPAGEVSEQSSPKAIRFHWEELQDEPASSPLITGQIGEGPPITFLADTAATHLVLFARGRDSRFDPLLPWLRGEMPYSLLGTDLEIGTSRGKRKGTMYRTPNPLSLGGVEYLNVNAVVLERDAVPYAFPVRHDRFAVLGQSLLLRHKRLCFDWQDELLHLGELGPCVDGIEVDDAELRHGLSIHLASPMPSPRQVEPSLGHAQFHDPNRLPVLVDTGATSTICSQRFVDLNDGNRTFSLSKGSGLTATCHTVDQDGSLFYDDSGYGGFRLALIGMDTLQEFRAFGWELAPLRLYFVPHEEEGKAS